MHGHYFSSMDGRLFDVSQQAQGVARQRFAFFSDRNTDTAKIAIAVFAEGFHIKGVVITEVPLILLSKKDQCATNLPVG